MAGGQRPGRSVRQHDVWRFIRFGTVQAPGAFGFKSVLDNDRAGPGLDGFERRRRDHGGCAPVRREIARHLGLQGGGHAGQLLHADAVRQGRQCDIGRHHVPVPLRPLRLGMMHTATWIVIPT